MTHKVSEVYINSIVQPTSLFTQTDKLNTTKLANTETILTKNHQYNGTTPPLETQPPSPY